jgi:hypothetical protein
MMLNFVDAYARDSRIIVPMIQRLNTKIIKNVFYKVIDYIVTCVWRIKKCYREINNHWNEIYSWIAKI